MKLKIVKRLIGRFGTQSIEAVAMDQNWEKMKQNLKSGFIHVTKSNNEYRIEDTGFCCSVNKEDKVLINRKLSMIQQCVVDIPKIMHL